MSNELKTKLDAILEDKQTNLLPENLKKGITLLGVTGTLEEGSGEVINTSDKPVCHMFYSDEEAKAFTGYNPGDRALVYELNAEPFTLNFGRYAIDRGLNTAVNNTALTYTTRLHHTVILPEPIELDNGIEWTEGTGKQADKKFWITITPTSCNIIVQNIGNYMLNLTETFMFTSEDGLTYTFIGRQASNMEDVTMQDSIDMPEDASKSETLLTKLTEKWSELSVLSRFLYVDSSRILKKIYMYEPTLDMNDDNNFTRKYELTDNVCGIDVTKSIITPNRKVFVPYNKPISVQKLYDAFCSVGVKRGTIAYTTDENIIYIADRVASLYVLDDEKHICVSQKIALNNDGTEDKAVVYKYNLSNDTYETITNLEPTYPPYEGDEYLHLDTCPTDILVSFMDYYYSVNEDTNVTTHNFSYTSIYFYNVSDTGLVSVGTVGYTRTAISPSLREEPLGLYGDAEKVKFGSTAFINDYIVGDMEAVSDEDLAEIEGEFDAINAVLDEVIGGEQNV